MEILIAASEQLLRAIFERSPMGISIIDTRLRFLQANPSYQRMLGYTAPELRERSLRDVTHPEDYAANARMFEELLSGEREKFSLEKRFVRKDCAVVWGRVTVMLIRGSDETPHRFASLVEDITERRQAEARELHEERALLQAARKLQELARRLVEAEELQRHRIAGELHDRVGQNLSALNINLDIALGMLAEPSADGRPELKLRLADSLALVDGTLQTIENLMAELRPPLLDEYGLSAALAAYVKAFAQRTGVRVSVEDPDELGPNLRHDAALALFRIVQEALANVAKHAKASRVRIALERQDHGTVLSITDDGLGFDVDDRLSRRTRWGVTTMQERAAAVGGDLYLESAPGTGTTIRVTLPAAG